MCSHLQCTWVVFKQRRERSGLFLEADGLEEAEAGGQRPGRDDKAEIRTVDTETVGRGQHPRNVYKKIWQNLEINARWELGAGDANEDEGTLA